MSPAGVAGVVDVVVTAPGGVVFRRLVRSSPMGCVRSGSGAGGVVGVAGVGSGRWWYVVTVRGPDLTGATACRFGDVPARRSRCCRTRRSCGVACGCCWYG